MLASMLKQLRLFEPAQDMRALGEAYKKHGAAMALLGGPITGRKHHALLTASKIEDIKSGWAGASEHVRDLLDILLSLPTTNAAVAVLTGPYWALDHASVDAATIARLSKGLEGLGYATYELRQVHSTASTSSVRAARGRSPGGDSRGASRERGSSRGPSRGASRGKSSDKPRSDSSKPDRRGGARLGTCYNCGGKGHVSKDCPQDGPTCFTCGQVGHISPDCTQGQGEATVKVANGGSSREGGATNAVCGCACGCHARPVALPPALAGEEVEELARAVIASAGSIRTDAQNKVLIDSGSDRNLAFENGLTGSVPHEAALVGFNGSTESSPAAGVLHARLTCARNPAKSVVVQVDAWASPNLSMTILSASCLRAAGAIVHIETDDNYVDFSKLGGPRLYMSSGNEVGMVLLGCDSDEVDSDEIELGTARTARAAGEAEWTTVPARKRGSVGLPVKRRSLTWGETVTRAHERGHHTRDWPPQLEERAPVTPPLSRKPTPRRYAPVGAGNGRSLRATAPRAQASW